MEKQRYRHALSYPWLNRLYDPVVSVTTRERVFREKLLESADLKPGDRVLDLACGTGSFAALLKKRYPTVKVVGLDGDSSILELAQTKIKANRLDVQFDAGMSFAMPYGDDEFDVVFSSLFFHHLVTNEKNLTLAEIRRVLKPAGVLHVCDWGRPSNWFSRLRFLGVRVLDGFDVTDDNLNGRLPTLIEGAGFKAVQVRNNI